MKLATDFVLDVTLEELERDPYPTYQWMRENQPIAWLPGTEQVLVATWNLCDEAGNNDSVFQPDAEFSTKIFGSPNVLALNGDEHTAMRNRVNPPFRPRAVRGYRDTLLRATARRYLEAVKHLGRIDAVDGLLEPISRRAVGDLIGFDDVPDETLGRWLDAYAVWVTDFGRDPLAHDRVERVKVELRELLEAKIAQPPPAAGLPPSAIWHMLHDGMEPGTARSVDDLIGNLGVMIIGGFQEPAHAAATTLYGLLGRPEQAAAFAERPAELSAAAVEEGLRWMAPFGTTEKRTSRAVDLGGVHFPQGTPVALVIGSANRDASRWTDADVYDLFREEQNHASFGYGLHFCIGHFTARNLAQVLLEEIFETLPGVRLDPESPAEVRGWVARGPKTLPIVWDAP
jgi:cytochrome P450